MADRNKLSQIEKKMDMSLDEIIKANKSKASGGVRKAGVGQGAKPGRAPLVMGKGQAGGKGKAQAPKSLATKAGVAGKRQAIQQKRAAAKATTGVRVKPSTGGIAKAAPKRAGSMAQKILNKARQSKQQAPKQLGGRPKQAQQAPKQLSTTKQARKPVQFNGNAKQQPQRQQQQQMSAPKSVAQRMNQQRRGGNQNVGKQQAPARAPLRLGNGGGNRHGRGGGGGGGPAPMQLDRPMAGGVRKRQQRAPIFQQSRAQQYQHQQVARQAPIHQHQQQRAPLGPRMGGAIMQPRMAPISNARGYRGALMQQQQPMRAPRMPINLVDTAKQQAALQALRLQQMEEERNRAERRLYMHQQMEMLGAPTRNVPRQGGAGYGGSEGVRGMGGGAGGGYREVSRAPVVLNGRMGNNSRSSYERYADYA